MGGPIKKDKLFYLLGYEGQRYSVGNPNYPQLVSTFMAMKRFEVERFNDAVGDLDVETVSEWEIEEYAAHL